MGMITLGSRRLTSSAAVAAPIVQEIMPSWTLYIIGLLVLCLIVVTMALLVVMIKIYHEG